MRRIRNIVAIAAVAVGTAIVSSEEVPDNKHRFFDISEISEEKRSEIYRVALQIQKLREDIRWPGRVESEERGDDAIGTIDTDAVLVEGDTTFDGENNVQYEGQIKGYWNEAEPSFNRKLRGLDSRNLPHGELQQTRGPRGIGKESQIGGKNYQYFNTEKVDTTGETDHDGAAANAVVGNINGDTDSDVRRLAEDGENQPNDAPSTPNTTLAPVIMPLVPPGDTITEAPEPAPVVAPDTEATIGSPPSPEESSLSEGRIKIPTSVPAVSSPGVARHSPVYYQPSVSQPYYPQNDDFLMDHPVMNLFEAILALGNMNMYGMNMNMYGMNWNMNGNSDHSHAPHSHGSGNIYSKPPYSPPYGPPYSKPTYSKPSYGRPSHSHGGGGLGWGDGVPPHVHAFQPHTHFYPDPPQGRPPQGIPPQGRPPRPMRMMIRPHVHVMMNRPTPRPTPRMTPSPTHLPPSDFFPHSHPLGFPTDIPPHFHPVAPPPMRTMRPTPRPTPRMMTPQPIYVPHSHPIDRPSVVAPHYHPVAQPPNQMMGSVVLGPHTHPPDTQLAPHNHPIDRPSDVAPHFHPLTPAAGVEFHTHQPEPTPSPTSSPTPRPTSSPTPRPTNDPSPGSGPPVDPPTDTPVVDPTDPPVAPPVASPVESPVAPPVAPPVAAATESPTVFPTFTPGTANRCFFADGPTVGCPDENLGAMCDKYNQIGSFTDCYDNCIRAFCCIHDSISTRAPSCSTEPNCQYFHPCYIIWFKLHDTIGPAPYLRLDQNEAFYNINTDDFTQIINGNQDFFNQLFGHHFLDDDLPLEDATFEDSANW